MCFGVVHSLMLSTEKVSRELVFVACAALSPKNSLTHSTEKDPRMMSLGRVHCTGRWINMKLTSFKPTLCRTQTLDCQLVVAMATTLHLVVLATLLGQGYCNPAHWFRYVGDSLWRAKPPCKGAFSLQEDGKIVGGTAAEVGEFPFLVPIKYSNGNQFCGGSIINERFVLTAAHCVPDGDPTGLMITAGDYCTNIAEDSEYNIGVSRVILSDDWTGDNLAGDLALLELAAPLDLSSGLVGPIQLSDGGSCEEGTLTVAGWGYTRSGGISSLYPQKVDVDVVPLDTCRSQYAKETLYDSQICAASPGSDSCQGDSGGPLFNLNCDSKPVLVGVVSWGYGCADARYSGVYTRVSSYKDWINTNTV